MNNFFRIACLLATVVAILFVWTAVTEFGMVNESLFPGPPKVLAAFVEMSKTGELVGDSAASLSRVLLGFFIGGVFGIALGLLTGRIEPLNLTVGQLLHFLRNIPPIAFVPLAIIWFGIGEFSKIFLVVWSVTFPVWINTHVGVTQIQKEYLWIAEMFGASKLQAFKEVVLPASTNYIITGLRIGIGMAFIALVAAELTAAASGMGFRISNSHLLFRTDKMLVGILLLGFFGMLAVKLFAFLATKSS